MTCKCGHEQGHHLTAIMGYQNPCSACATTSGKMCPGFIPAAPEAPAWLDKPDSDDGDWLAVSIHNQLHLVTVCSSRGLWWNTASPGSPAGYPISDIRKWIRPPAMPPPPLPKLRTVTLTAMMDKQSNGISDFWLINVFADGMSVDKITHRERQKALSICVKRWGINPEVES